MTPKLNIWGTWTLFKRETWRFLKVYMQTLLAPVMSNLLYFAIFGLSLHRAIPDIQSVSYLAFLVPGLILMGIINNSYQNPYSSLIIMKYQGLIGDLMTIPLSRGAILFAFTASAVLRGLLVGLMTYLTAIFFVDFTYESVATIFAAAILVSLFFSFLGIFTGIWADEFDKAAFLQNFILQPLIFLGGIFYPISSLPGVMKTISNFNPIVYMIDLFRYGFTGVHEYSLSLSLMVVSSLTLALGLVCYFMLQRGWKLQN